MTTNDMFHIIHKHDLTGYTALIPSVGVGNVAQLAADLLISTLNMELIATIWHPAIIPLVGPQAFMHNNYTKKDNDVVSNNNITTACELYIAEAQKLIVFQIRSPLVASLMDDFFENIINFFHAESIKQLIILTSSYAYEMHVVESTPYNYMAQEKFISLLVPNGDDDAKQIKLSEFTGNIIHGGGYAKKLMETAVERNINAIILFKYVSEGDNTHDAEGLIRYLNKFFGYLVNDNKLKIPHSWLHLYGNNAPKHLY